jgi:NADH-quinone oxidoreductase subunit C
MNSNKDQLEVILMEQFPEQPTVSCERTDFQKLGFDFKLTIEPGQVLKAAAVIKEQGFAIDMVTAVDWPEEEQFELIYDFMHFESALRVAVHTRVPRDQPVIESLAEVYPGANWHERETAEFFGIDFRNHPNLIHLLLPEDMEGYPLRKDFKPEPSPY